MPSEAFEDLWRDLKAGRPWTGLVKNRCKNGDYYWVLATATPTRDASGNVDGYMSVRRKATAEQIRAQPMRPIGYSGKSGPVACRFVTGGRQGAAGYWPTLTEGQDDGRFAVTMLLALVVVAICSVPGACRKRTVR